MKPLYLYIENFQCHEASEMDLSTFNSALIVGCVDGNTSHSNGVGKSTIFKAIEFVVFNECSKGLKLEKLIRDDTNKCKVVFDFESDAKIYRISRSRTKKGSTDLTLFERTGLAEPGINPHSIFSDEAVQKKFWTDISGRRTPDTEEVLEKIHKMNYNAFCSGYYFAQDDYSTGLATATKTERKNILKGSLQLIIYNYLMKLSSARASSMLKDLEKNKTVFETLGDPTADIANHQLDIKSLQASIIDQDSVITNLTNDLSGWNTKLSDLKTQFKLIFDQVDVVLKKREDANQKLAKIQITIDDYLLKKKSAIAVGKTIGEELKSLKDSKIKLEETDLSEIDLLSKEIEDAQSILNQSLGTIAHLKTELSDLMIPLPDDGFCKHCRQPLTDTHRRECKKTTDEEIASKKDKIRLLDIQCVECSKKLKLREKLKTLTGIQKKLELIVPEIVAKEKEFDDKKSLFNEYETIIKKHLGELDELKIEISKIELEIEASSSKELEELRKAILIQENEVAVGNKKLRDENSTLVKLGNQKAILEHSLAEKNKQIQEKATLQGKISTLEDQYEILPDVIEAYGPTGIPNLIIQDVLDELQIEANNILEQIRPGLQLSFIIEKTKGDGQQDDELDIDYFLNNKPRDYAQLSGAQKLCVMFALKLGVAYLLKNKLGTVFKMLLLDEIDPALDKASVDAFAEIIKFFQKDFTILVITHNDRLKDKFTHAILVEQDQNMVSKATVVTNW